MSQILVTVPLLNANEPEARLVGIHAREGQAVKTGDLLFTVETTKAASDVESPADGFFRLIAEEGATLQVGDPLAMITETAEEALDDRLTRKSAPAAEVDSQAGSASLRITRPARELAERLGLDFSQLPSDVLITEAVVRQVAGLGGGVELPTFHDRHLLIYGGGGHAKAVLEMAQAMNIFEIAGIVDDKLPPGTEVLGIPILGRGDLLGELRAHGLLLAANGVGGILDINVRVKLFERMQAAGLDFPALVHPRATLEPSARVGAGVQVFANAYVGSSAILHPKCMINTNAVVSHDCEIGSYSHIAPGALLAGHVQVGERSLVGMGVTIAIGVKLGNGVRVGNGAILYADVPDRTIISAGRVWDGKAQPE